MNGKGSQIKRGMSALHITKRVVEVIVNVVFLTIWGVAMLNPHLSPRISQIPAFLSLGFPVILLLFTLMWLGYLVRRCWCYFGLYTIVGLLSSGFIFTYFPIHFGKGLKPKHDLRIMTFNVAAFGIRGEDGEITPDDVILSYDADIVCLQEGSIYFNREKDMQYLKALFGKKYTYIKNHPALRLTLLSNYPIIYAEEVKYPSQTNGTWMYLLQMPDDETILIVNNHMESYSLAASEKDKFREYLKDFSLENLPGQTLEVKHRLGPMLNKRAYAAERVCEQLRRYKEEYNPTYTVVLGDFNDIPMSYTYMKLRDGRRDAYAECGLGLGISFNERLMPFRIDHMFYEGKLKAIGCDIPRDRKVSDHNPLIVDFSFVK